MNKLSRAECVETGGEGIPEDLGGTKLDGAIATDKRESKVLSVKREQFSTLGFEEKSMLTEKLSAKEWTELPKRFWVEGGEYEKNN